MKPNPPINLKDKIDDAEMDLSMCGLHEVPVREISAFKKIYSLDLSNNHLVSLPKTFSTLTHLTKLDLSKNSLKILPENFGDLIKLQYLDLYKNDLQHLPMSFSNLKKLRWLDLKDNPLVPAIKEAAGQCLDAKQCESSAKSIVSFYSLLKQKVQEEKEQREQDKQKHLKELEEKETAQKAKQAKKARKKERAKKLAEENVPSNGDLKVSDPLCDASPPPLDEDQNTRSLMSAFFTYVSVLLVFVSVFMFSLTAIEMKEAEPVGRFVKDTWTNLMQVSPPYVQEIGNSVSDVVIKVHQAYGEFILNIAEAYSNFVHKERK